MRVLVAAKAPVSGLVKTRLGSVIGPDAAAAVAAAALLDTIEVASSAVGPVRCHLSLAGDLSSAVRGAEITGALAGWTVTAQRGEGLAARLAAAHLDAGPGPVAQIGMDTPQVTASDLADVFADLVGVDAVLGAAGDGGWWVLARYDPNPAQVLAEVAMSTPTTYADTWAALESRGQRMAATRQLRDVDTIDDAEAVARAAPATRFAQTWRVVAGVAS